MRDKIREVLHKHDEDPYGVDMSGKRKINAEKAANELTILMVKTCLSMMTVIDECVKGKGDKSVQLIMEECGFTEAELNDFFKVKNNEG